MAGSNDAPVTVRVRMYRHGLGDCFLLKFERRGGAPAFMLIDCGVLLGTAQAAEKMRDVMDDIRQTTGGRLAAMVATHEHWDHLSGFIQAKDVFESLTVEETWLAWTEDPLHPLARDLKSERRRLAAALATAARRLGTSANPAAKQCSERVLAMLGFFDLAADGQAGTQAALESVRRKAKVLRYLRPGGEPVRVPGVAGVRVYVLGPPEDEKLLKRSSPTRRGQETYDAAPLLALEDAFASAVENLGGETPAGWDSNFPFDVSHQILPAEAADRPFFKRHYGSGDDEAWRRIEEEWLGSADQLALKLDNDTNNTSLALAIEVEATGKVLLFPGDAQVGNWLSWAGRSWSARDPDGREYTVTGADLLRRTVLYKVAHHGSHNATLREKGLELMTSPELVALVPVDLAMARSKRWEMPFPSLLQRLAEKTAGRVLLADSSWSPAKPPEVTDQFWANFLATVDLTPLSIEYAIR